MAKNKKNVTEMSMDDLQSLAMEMLLGVSDEQKAYDKYTRKLGQATRARGSRAAHAIIDGRVDKAFKQARKLLKQKDRLDKIDSRMSSGSHWDRFKGRMRRAHYNLRYVAS